MMMIPTIITGIKSRNTASTTIAMAAIIKSVSVDPWNGRMSTMENGVESNNCNTSNAESNDRIMPIKHCALSYKNRQNYGLSRSTNA